MPKLDPSIFDKIKLHGITVKEALDILENGCPSEDENEQATIFITPPAPTVLTDEDSAGEDEGGTANNLNRNQLSAEAEIRTRRADVSLEIQHGSRKRSTEHKRSGIKARRKWIKGDLTFNKPYPFNPNYEFYKGMDPVEIFELFISDEIISMLVNESRSYALFLNQPDPNISAEEMKCFIAILLLSGYNVLPGKRFYWDCGDDMLNMMVSNAMRRDRFISIMRFVHMCDNNNLDASDKMWKLRPFTDMLKCNFIKHFVPCEVLSYDESMIKYYGRHPCKQFIRGKPIRFGYKVWALNTVSGYLLNFDIYQGKNPRGNILYEQRFGKAAAPLVGMLDELPAEKRNVNYLLFFDNLFTSMPLLEHLKKLGYFATGTIRQNRIPKECPIVSKKDMQKCPRGSSDYAIDHKDGIFIARWKDNSVVSIASTAFGNEPVSTVKRYSKEEKKIVSVQQPHSIKCYNSSMGGTDRMNQDVNEYRISIRGKKWWWVIFTWLLDVAVNNSWTLYKATGRKIEKLAFRRYIVQAYLTKYKSEKKKTGPSNSRISLACPGRFNDAIRFDNQGHLVVPIEKKRMCAYSGCKSIMRTKCVKCDVGVCLPHFLPYHKK